MGRDPVAAREPLASREVGVTILHAPVDDITESNVMLVAAGFARMTGLDVRLGSQVRRLPERHGLGGRLCLVAYEALDDVNKSTGGFLVPQGVEFEPHDARNDRYDGQIG